MTKPNSLLWWQQGEASFAAAADRLSDDELDGSSLLAGWSRRTVLAHVACNADALVNLLTWATTGVETPMYASPDARDLAIKEAASLPSPGLARLSTTASQRLSDAVASVPADAWTALVRTAQGRTVPASEVLWMRSREVWVHAVDLDNGATFAAMPEDVLGTLIEDVLRTWERRDQAVDIRLTDGRRTWGTGARTIDGTVDQLAAYVTGRSPAPHLAHDLLPDLPNWL